MYWKGRKREMQMWFSYSQNLYDFKFKIFYKKIRLLENSLWLLEKYILHEFKVNVKFLTGKIILRGILKLAT